MKRIIIALILLITPLLVTGFVSADTNVLGEVCDGVTDSSVCDERNNTGNPISGANGILIRAAKFISLLTGIASVIITIFGSIKYITSSGNPESAASAKKTIIYALVGVAIALLSQGIIVFVLNRIG